MSRLGRAGLTVGLVLAVALGAAPGALAVGSDLIAGHASGDFAVSGSCCGLGDPLAVADADEGSSWASGGEDPKWIRVDLGASTYVDGYRLKAACGSGSSSRLQGSADGSTWTTVVDSIAYTTDTTPVPFADVAYRYWRVLGVSCSNVLQVFTWRLYAGVAPTPTPTPAPTATPTPAPSSGGGVSCSDPCTVALSEADRDRLDLLTGVSMLGFAVGGGLLSAIVIAQVRRGG